MNEQTKAYLYGLSAVLAWSTVASAFKLALREFTVLQLLLIASLISTLTLFIIILIQNKLHLLKQISRTVLLRSALLGLLNPFIYYIVLFYAYDLLPAQIAQPLNYTWPLVLTLLSAPLLNQKITRKAILALLISFSGVLVISTGGNFTNLKFVNLTGTVLALGSTLIWSLFWIANLKDNRDPVIKLFMLFFPGTIYIAIAGFISGEIPQLSLSIGSISAVYVGVFEMGLTFVFWLKALSLARDSASVSNLIYLSPFASLVLIHYIVGEDIWWTSIVGLVLIVGGIVLQGLSRRDG
jgi:drug/metabolite transporter (DMT)-like permease